MAVVFYFSFSILVNDKCFIAVWVFMTVLCIIEYEAFINLLDFGAKYIFITRKKSCEVKNNYSRSNISRSQIF